jgi:hypothetical protein
MADSNEGHAHGIAHQTPIRFFLCDLDYERELTYLQWRK